MSLDTLTNISIVFWYTGYWRQNDCLLKSPAGVSHGETSCALKAKAIFFSCWQTVMFFICMVIHIYIYRLLSIHDIYFMFICIFSIEATMLPRPGVGVTKSPLVNFSVSELLILQKYPLDSLDHIHIWHVSPQLSRGDTCQIWTWYSIHNVCLTMLKTSENNGTEEIGLVTPTPVGKATLNNRG